MENQELMEKSMTIQTKIVFPAAQNEHRTLFGGEAMKWMDEVAYICALRFAKQPVVTANCENIKFLKPIHEGDIVDIVAKVQSHNSIKLTIVVEVFSEKMYETGKMKCVSAIFTFVAVNKNDKITKFNFCTN